MVVQQAGVPELPPVAAAASIRRRREPELFSRKVALELQSTPRQQGPFAGVGPNATSDVSASSSNHFDWCRRAAINDSRPHLASTGT